MKINAIEPILHDGVAYAAGASIEMEAQQAYSLIQGGHAELIEGDTKEEEDEKTGEQNEIVLDAEIEGSFPTPEEFNAMKAPALLAYAKDFLRVELDPKAKEKVIRAEVKALVIQTKAQLYTDKHTALADSPVGGA